MTGKRPSISITGVQPGCNASWAERFSANFGKNPLGPLFGLTEAQHILKEAVRQPPVLTKLDQSPTPPGGESFDQRSLGGSFYGNRMDFSSGFPAPPGYRVLGQHLEVPARLDSGDPGGMGRGLPLRIRNRRFLKNKPIRARIFFYRNRA